MELLRKAENLTEAYALLDPNCPLDNERWMRFYARRPEEASLTHLRDALQIDPSDDDKTLFTGHRGSGKTTELAQLELALRDTHTVVRFNVESLLNLGDVDYADLLVVLGLQVFQAARRSGVRLDKNKLHDLLFWYTTRVFEKDERRKLESEAGGEVDAILAKFSVKFTTDAPRRETIRSEARANLSDLLERLNSLLEAFRDKSGRRTMVIVDGLDKMYDLKQVCDLFCQGANALMEPRCRVVYSVPLSIYHTDDFQQVRMAFDRTFSLPNVKAEERDGTPCREGQAALMEMLDNRLMPGLLAPEAVERLVALCGGLPKELIGLARETALRARRVCGEGGPAEVEDVEQAARQVRNTYRSALTSEQYSELWRLYSGGPFVNSPVARSLLHNLSLLEYNGDGAWWSIHPIVRPLLEERADEFEDAA